MPETPPWLRGRIPLVALGALCAAAAITLAALGAQLTFFNDEWFVLLQRPGLNGDSVFAPHNGHLSALPVLIYKGFAEAFGLDSRFPLTLLLVAVILTLVVLVFVYVSERAGEILALLAAAVLLFLGPAWQDLLWPFQIGLIGSLTTGVAVLLALERETPRANVAACALLVLSISLSNLGVSFILAAAVAVLLRRRPAELWVPGVPALLFAIWWLAYGTDAPSDFSLYNAYHAPFYVLDMIAAGFASLAGVSLDVDNRPNLAAWGRPLLALAAIGIAAWALRGGRPSRGVAIVATAAFSFWILVALNHVEWRTPSESRYQLVSGVFLVLLAAELFRPVRLERSALAIGGVLALVVIGANIGALKNGYDLLRYESHVTKADLGALDIGRGNFAPSFRLLRQNAQDLYQAGITAEAYFRERDEHGSPAYTPAQIAAAEPGAQRSADNVMAAGYGLGVAEVIRAAGTTPANRCAKLDPATAAAEVPLGPGAVLVTNLGGAPSEIHIRRFAPPELPIGIGTLAGGFSARFRVPVDRASVPWRLGASAGSSLEVCTG